MIPVLEVQGLQTEFRLKSSTVLAVDDVSFRVDPGECVGLVGESGCGKTTIGLSIMKLLPNVGHVVGGSIRLLGQDLAPLGEKEMCKVRGNQVGMVFQDPLTSLNPTMSIGDQIAESARLHQGASKKVARERALEVLKMVEMPNPSGRLDAYAHELSGGLRQRVMIAMALVCTPKLLVADEPTTALDVTIQAQILDLLDRLRRDLDMSIILITHDMGVIAERADRVLVMYAGRIAEGATTTEVFTRMRHPYSEALLASVAKLDQDPSIRLVSIPGLPPDLSQPMTHCRFAARCQYVQPDCRESEPELLPAADSAPGHVARCFHQVGVDPVTIANRPEAVAKAADLHVKVDEEALAREQVRAEALHEAPALVTIDHVVKEFAVTSGALVQRNIGTVKAVSDVSLTIRRGETFGLVGESGCGKTTMGRMVVALETPTAGAVQFEDENIVGLSGRAMRRRRRDMQMMFQDPYASLDPRMRVGSILREPLTVQGIGTRHEQQQQVLRMLDEVGLPPRSAELLPPRVLGRPAPAHRPGPGLGARAQADRGRRARLGPRRLHSGADPEPAEGAPGAARPDLSLHFARPGHREVHGGPDRRHVPGQARRDRSGPRDLRAHCAPLYAGADRHHPGGRPHEEGATGGAHPRRAAVAARPPVGMPVPHTVPLRPRGVRRRGASPAPLRRGPPRCLPLPAADAHRARRGRAGADSRHPGLTAPRLSAAAGGPPARPAGRPR